MLVQFDDSFNVSIVILLFSRIFLYNESRVLKCSAMGRKNRKCIVVLKIIWTNKKINSKKQEFINKIIDKVDSYVFVVIQK